MAVVIRPLESVDDFRACEALQRRAWKMSNDLNVVPLHVLLAVQRHGGVLLGAIDGSELVGFVFGFPCFSAQGKLKHCSHMLGIAPEYQSQGLGYELKLAQRESVLHQGLDLVSWTYDPLESRNAALNIRKLGAVCQTFVQDIYGAIGIGLYAGMPTDRFEVDWWIASDRVQRRLDKDSSSPSAAAGCRAIVTGRTPAGLLTPASVVLDAGAATVWAEIPESYQAIKAADSGLALEWRMAARQVFETYFAMGYAVTDFVQQWSGSERRCFYVLNQGGWEHAD